MDFNPMLYQDKIISIKHITSYVAFKNNEQNIEKHTI